MYSSRFKILSLIMALTIIALTLSGCTDNNPTSTDVSESEAVSAPEPASATLDFVSLGLWDYNDLSDYLENQTFSHEAAFNIELGEYIKLFSNKTSSTEITDYKTPLSHNMVLNKYDSIGNIITIYTLVDPKIQSATESSQSDESSFDAPQKTLVTVWGNANDKTLKSAVDLYNQNSSLYKVEIITDSTSRTTATLSELKRAKAENSLPDIVYTDSVSVLSGARQGLFADLVSLGFAEYESSFTPSAYRAFGKDAAVYGVPFDGEATCLAYNPEILDFVKSQNTPENYQQLVNAATEITEYYSDKNAPIGLSLNNNPEDVADTFISWLYRCGGKMLSEDGKSAEFDSAMGERALTLICDLYKKDLADTSWTLQEFYSGKTAFYEVSSDLYNQTFGSGARANFEAAPLPLITNGENPSLFSVNGFAMTAGEDMDKIQGAYDFLIYYCTNHTYQTQFCLDNSRIPTLVGLQKSRSFDDRNMQFFIAAMEGGKTYPSTQGMNIIKKYLSDAVWSAINDGVAPADALAKAAAKTESRLARN